MEIKKTFDDELKLFLEMLFVYHCADEDLKEDFLSDIADWFDENETCVGAVDPGLHQAISQILEDGVISDAENETLIHFVMDHINSHKKFDYKTYSQGKQRLSRKERENIVLYEVGDKDFIGKTVVITGDFEKFPKRKEAEIEIMRRGGRTSSSVSGQTDMLICGEGAGWAKVEQVKRRNAQGNKTICLIDEDTFYKMLESNEVYDR